MCQQRHESGGERLSESETKKRGADRSNSDLPTPHGGNYQRGWLVVSVYLGMLTVNPRNSQMGIDLIMAWWLIVSLCLRVRLEPCPSQRSMRQMGSLYALPP
jgi:hypothetical protein